MCFFLHSSLFLFGQSDIATNDEWQTNWKSYVSIEQMNGEEKARLTCTIIPDVMRYNSPFNIWTILLGIASARHFIRLFMHFEFFVLMHAMLIKNLFCLSNNLTQADKTKTLCLLGFRVHSASDCDWDTASIVANANNHNGTFDWARQFDHSIRMSSHANLFNDWLEQNDVLCWLRLDAIWRAKNGYNSILLGI